MIQTRGTIVEKKTIAPAWWRLDFAAPKLTPVPQPGQFLLCRCFDDLLPCYLRRAIFPAIIEPGRFSCLLNPAPDPGFAWLLARNVGDQVDLIGPLGLSFPLLPHVQNLLLVSDRQTIGPLLAQMDQAIAQGAAVTLALGASRAAAIYPLSALPPAVELQAATRDGSLGYRGQITELTPDLLRWADVVFAAGSMKLYRTLKTQVAAVRLGAEDNFLYGLITDLPLACGVGACLSCAIETATGLKLGCVDGPIFDLMQIDF